MFSICRFPVEKTTKRLACCFVPALIIVMLPYVAEYIAVSDARNWRNRSLRRSGRIGWSNNNLHRGQRFRDYDDEFPRPQRPRKQQQQQQQQLRQRKRAQPVADYEDLDIEENQYDTIEDIERVDVDGIVADDFLRPSRPPIPDAKQKILNEQPEKCTMDLAETLPDGLYPDLKSLDHLTIHEAWIKLFKLAETRIEIVSYHWGLRRGSGKGEEVYNVLASAIKDRGLKVKIIHTSNHTDEEAYDTSDLKRLNPSIVEVRSIDVASLLNSVGVLHSKLLIADRKHFYLGSANLSDRGLTRTKEMGVLVTSCPRLAEDSGLLFDVYWELSRLGRVPDSWPSTYASQINLVSPQLIENTEDGHYVKAYLGSSPKPFCPKGRTDDLTAIVDTIDAAEEFIYISVADYVPMRIFGERQYWPLIDDRLRMAAINRNVTVRLLVSDRANSRPYMKRLLWSLSTLNGMKQIVKLEIKLFQADIPHFRSSHNKYMVTDKTGYVGTSNWTKDYFLQTAGLAVIFESAGKTSSSKRKSKDVREKLVDVFLRDWNGPWAKELQMIKS